MVNAFNVVVAMFRLTLAFFMLFIGIILLIHDPRIGRFIGSESASFSMYIGALLTVAAFVLGVISVESKPIPGPKGEPGPGHTCTCGHCSNFKYYEVPTDIVSEEIVVKPIGPESTTLKEM